MHLMSYSIKFSCIVLLIITTPIVHGGKIAPKIQKGTSREVGTCTKVKCVKLLPRWAQSTMALSHFFLCHHFNMYIRLHKWIHCRKFSLAQRQDHTV